MTPGNAPLSKNDPPKPIKILKMTPQQNGQLSVAGNKWQAPRLASSQLLLPGRMTLSPTYK